LIRIVDAILTGVHRPGESHFELLEAFTDDAVLAEISEAFSAHSYRPHEFGDSMLIEQRAHGTSLFKHRTNFAVPLFRSPYGLDAQKMSHLKAWKRRCRQCRS